jgi:hypothetical protein
VLALALLALALPVSRAAAGPGDPLKDINVNVSNESGAQSTADIAIDPTDTNHMIGGSNDLSTGNVRVYESFDLGRTWTNTALPSAPGFDGFSADPAVAFDAAGNAYYSFMGIDRSATATTIVVTKKPAGSPTWGAPVTLPNTDGFKPLMTVDRSPSSPFENTIYVASIRPTGTIKSLFPPKPKPSVVPTVARSTDGGATFSATTIGDAGTSVLGADPAVGPDGRLYVVWSDAASHALMVASSSDRGATFGAAHPIQHWAAPTGSGFTVGIPADPQRGPGDQLGGIHCSGCRSGVPIFAYIDVDRSSGPNRGTVYAVYNDATATNGLDVFLVKSSDGGATWSAPLRVNDDPPGVVHDQFLPRLAVDEADGSLHVAFYDTRDDPNNTKTNLYYARSTDGGASFAPNTRVTTAQSDESGPASAGCSVNSCPPDTNGDIGPPRYGAYIGIAVSNGLVRPLWTDNRSGSEEIFTGGP